MLKGKKIVLGVTGGIAIYKVVDLVSKLRKQGAEVRVVMTEHAAKFVSPLLFAEISGHKCAVSMWDGRDEFNVEHIALANWGDLLLVAPATANILAKMACGLADDLLSTVLLSAPFPKIVCPAMNTGMYENVGDAGKPESVSRPRHCRNGTGFRRTGLRHDRRRKASGSTGDYCVSGAFPGAAGRRYAGPESDGYRSGYARAH